jgi:hypothetical protein
MIQLINEGIISVPTEGRFGVNFKSINLWEKPDEEEIALISEKTNIPISILEEYQTKGELYKNVIKERGKYSKTISFFLSIDDYPDVLAKVG